MKRILACLSVVFLMSCGSSNTSIVSSWKEPSTTVANEQFKKVLVVALLKDDVGRRVVESKFQEYSPVFKTSFTTLNKNTKDVMTQELLVKLLKSEEFDGVVTMRLVDTQKETDYVAGMNTSIYYNTPYYGAYGAYGGVFGGWYNYYSPYYYDTGYYVENTYYFIETNIFSLKSDKLIWSGTTKSYNVAENLDETATNTIDAIVKQMQKDGSLPPAK